MSALQAPTLLFKPHSKCMSKSSGRWQIKVETRPSPAGNVDGSSKTVLQPTARTRTRATIEFISEGQAVQRTQKKQPIDQSVLSQASDWEPQVYMYIRKELVFPQELVAASQRPDMVLISRATMLFYIVELTVPWGDLLDISHQLKSTKYQHLVEESILKG